MSSQAADMDRIYGLHRYIYDITRKHYLLGRDRLLDRMEVSPNDHILEIGCGTGRNLVILAEMHPFAHYYGLDVSKQMLSTARNKVRRHKVEKQVTLKQGYAEELNYSTTFGLSQPFDTIFYSYAVTIIPTWQDALEASYKNLRPGGKLYVVDFWDMANLPDPIARQLKKWFKKFHVEYHPENIEHFKKWQQEGRGNFTMEGVGGRYAWLGCFTKKSS